MAEEVPLHDLNHPKERLARIMGQEGLERLADARVLVLGIGGVGSNCAEALVRGGLGGIVAVDGDVVAPSNINRQSIAFLSTVGLPKVQVFSAMAADIDPACTVEPVQRFVHAEDVAAFLDEVGPVDWVVDACDMVSTKLALAEECERRGQPLISSMGVANKLDPSAVAVADIYQTVNDPLARVMRKEARKRKIRSLTVAYSSEVPHKGAQLPGSERRERTDLGTCSYMPAVMGLTIAGHVIRQISGVGLA
ncbi:tRNA threonylcarbamoyladenosine dehydratase [Olsenella sp. YH-ols2217]|uniref:tRNA threonylcarbamoyladenosine dehydratase n=1 Tax=Kribbibacterium absianum TaxID=3044210 RepID=A0ABT6ZIZ4_9ACTN|nr:MULTISPECIES: tRNA threonylcarbamoyladenosine dehydratase [unclassified Olsenella]MDJ1120997.1 tRNA threonylcarbamoyladenosine dehydratase [Olsenella sp. YH-ols2216]MDJ1128488.1 tRNA threonylcarbamoyladenosine dehydratase [Olsenella sp. YH-ols2217]